MELDALRVLVKVAELQSFTHAAEHLGMSKSRASVRVQELETALGTRLLQRTTRTVRLTPDGERLLGPARQLLADADELGNLFLGARGLRGLVRVDLPATIARDLIIPSLPDLLARHPLLELQVSTTDRRVDVVREGFDCVLRVGGLDDSGLVARRLGALPMVNCASPAYLRRHGVPATLDDLDRHVVIDYAQRFGASAPGFEHRAPDGAYVDRPMRAVLSVNSADAYRVACLAGLGIIQVPRHSVREHLDDGSLVEVLP
ncbi:MAG: LysR family transcriptional regulator, partial [Myxococcales bacterium]|nr:LysR family transcriptional regulator [Myxococcales bacterium]